MTNLTEMTNRSVQSVSLRSFEGPPYPAESVQRLQPTQQERDELVKIDAKNKYLLESHIPAIVWSREHRGYRIQDMVDRHYFDVISLIQAYLPTDPLLRTITDPFSIDSYLATVKQWLPQTQSLVALKEGTREVIGFIIGRLVVEPEWFELVSQILFVTKKDKYAYLKRTLGKDGRGEGKSKAGRSGKRMSMSSRSSKVGKRASTSGKRSSKAGGRKSMGGRKSNAGGRKSMGGRKSNAGGRKSNAGGRKSMGGRKSNAGGRKSMGGRKSNAGGRKSMGGRKSLGGRKTMGGAKSGKGVKHAREHRDNRKVPRPVDVIPEEVTPAVPPAVFDDDEALYPDDESQAVHSFKKKLSERIRIWKMIQRKMYYRIYLFVVSPNHRQNGVGELLMESLKVMCQAFNVGSIAGVLTTYEAQNEFYRAGGMLVYEVLYKNYPLFDSLDRNSYNKSAAVVHLELPTPPEPTKAVTRNTSRGKL